MRLYHGSRAAFDAFDPSRVGEGAEGNSALGVWLTTDFGSAVAYGSGRAVMIVEAPPMALMTCSDPYIGIWGSTDLLPTDREISWQAFDQVRQEASAAGFGGVIFLGCEDGAMDGAICVFRPEDLTIVATIDYPETRDEGDHPASLSGADIRHDVTLEDALGRALAQETRSEP